MVQDKFRFALAYIILRKKPIEREIDYLVSTIMLTKEYISEIKAQGNGAMASFVNLGRLKEK